MILSFYVNWQGGDDHENLASDRQGSLPLDETIQDVFAKQEGMVGSCTATVKYLLFLILVFILYLTTATHSHTQNKKN